MAKTTKLRKKIENSLIDGYGEFAVVDFEGRRYELQISPLAPGVSQAWSASVDGEHVGVFRSKIKAINALEDYDGPSVEISEMVGLKKYLENRWSQGDSPVLLARWVKSLAEDKDWSRKQLEYALGFVWKLQARRRANPVMDEYEQASVKPIVIKEGKGLKARYIPAVMVEYSALGFGEVFVAKNQIKYRKKDEAIDAADDVVKMFVKLYEDEEELIMFNVYGQNGQA